MILGSGNHKCIVAARDIIKRILNEKITIDGSRSIEGKLISPLNCPIFCNSRNLVYVTNRDDHIETVFDGDRAAPTVSYLGEYFSHLCWVILQRPQDRH